MEAREIDWPAVRAQFPVCAERIWLNTATYGPGPRAALEAAQESLAAWAEGRGDWRAWELRGEDARASFARLIGCDAPSVALLPALSVAAAQVASSLEPRPRANLVVGEAEFRSNLFPWLAQRARGIELRVVPSRGGAPRSEDLARAVDGDTLLLAVSAVQSASGQRADLATLSGACREHGARLFVDGTQSVGALATSLEGIDYLAVAGYKWLCAPRGAAFLYAAPEHHASLTPLAPGWKTPADPYAAYYGPPFEPAPDATRCDVSLAWHAWVGAAAALELLLALGPGAIEARALGLAEDFVAGAEALGLRALFPRAERSQIIALEVPDPQAVEASLARARVAAAVRDRWLRVSFHFFNDASDVERTLAALERALRG